MLTLHEHINNSQTNFTYATTKQTLVQAYTYMHMYIYIRTYIYIIYIHIIYSYECTCVCCVTVLWKTDIMVTNTEINFLPVDESYTHELSMLD